MRESTKQKILLLMLGGLALGFSRSPHGHKRIIKTVAKEWQKIDRKKLRSEVWLLSRAKLLKEVKNPDGTYTFVLTEKGKQKALTFNFDKMSLKRTIWDGKWRFLTFDIPEKYRGGRDALRNKIKKLGFMELQKSVFVFPYPCLDELEFLIEFFHIRNFVRFGTMDSINNEESLKEVFGLK